MKDAYVFFMAEDGMDLDDDLIWDAIRLLSPTEWFIAILSLFFQFSARFIIFKDKYKIKKAHLNDLLIVNDIKDRWKDVTHSIKIDTP